MTIDHIYIKGLLFSYMTDNEQDRDLPVPLTDQAAVTDNQHELRKVQERLTASGIPLYETIGKAVPGLIDHGKLVVIKRSSTEEDARSGKIGRLTVATSDGHSENIPDQRYLELKGTLDEFGEFTIRLRQDVGMQEGASVVNRFTDDRGQPCEESFSLQYGPMFKNNGIDIFPLLVFGGRNPNLPERPSINRTTHRFGDDSHGYDDYGHIVGNPQIAEDGLKKYTGIFQELQRRYPPLKTALPTPPKSYSLGSIFRRLLGRG